MVTVNTSLLVEMGVCLGAEDFCASIDAVPTTMEPQKEIVSIKH